MYNEEDIPSAEDWAFLDDQITDEQQDISCFIAGLTEDTDMEAVPQPQAKPVPVSKKLKTERTKVSHGGYDLETLDAKYPSVPDTGPGWSQLKNITKGDYVYAVCTPQEELDDEGKVKGYKKKYGRWNKKWENISICDDYGVKVVSPYIVVDIDDMLQAKLVLKYIQDKRHKCMVMKTTKGLHFWFRLPDDFDYKKHDIKNESDVSVIGAIKVDYRVNGGGMACLKFRGAERPFIYGSEYKLDELDYLPLVLYKPLYIALDKYHFLGLAEGGRHNLFVEYRAALYGRELLTVEQCGEVLHFINDYLLPVPMEDSEMTTLCAAADFENIERRNPEAEFFKGAKFLHEKCAKYLISNYRFIPIDNKTAPMIYKDGYYQQDEDSIDIIIRSLASELTSNNLEQVKRVLHTLSVDQLRNNSSCVSLGSNGLPVEDPHIINLKNGRLNILTGEFTEHTPLAYDTQRVPTTYDPEATCPAVDQVLNTVFEGDEGRVQLFYEIAGTCLARNNSEFIRSFYLVGDGSNGKSTVIKMLRAMVGNKNISALKPGDMTTNSFNLCDMQGKLANIVEELNGDDITETAVYKQVVAGDSIRADRKHLPAINFVPYCTVIFATNSIPNFVDKSLGMERRYEILPFTVNFEELKRTNRNSYDPHIAAKITTEEAKSYILNRAVKAYQKLVERKEYTIPEVSAKAKKDYLLDNSPVRQWIEENDISSWYLSETPITLSYGRFCQYVIDDLGLAKPPIRKTWKNEVLRYFSKELKGTGRPYKNGEKQNTTFLTRDGLELTMPSNEPASTTKDIADGAERSKALEGCFQ